MSAGLRTRLYYSQGDDGQVTITGTGDIQAQTATIASTGDIIIEGTGDLIAQAADVDGSGGTFITGVGDLDAQSATVAGSGQVTQDITGTGALAAQAAQVNGAGTAATQGSGALVAQAAQIDGSGQIALEITNVDDPTPEVGVQVTYTHTPANAAGKLIRTDAGDITPDAQTTTTTDFTIPDIKTFGLRNIGYEVDANFDLVDGAQTAAQTLQVEPDPGHFHGTIASIDPNGVYADDVGVAIGDRCYAQFISGPGGTFDPTTGVATVTGTSTLRYWIQDDTDGVWGSPADEIIEFIVTGTGDLQAQAATVAGSGGTVGQIAGTGDLVAQAATMTGVGDIVLSGTGDLQAQDAQVDGSGATVIAGTGDLQAQDATVSGLGVIGDAVVGTGDLLAQDAQVDGAGDIIIEGIGALEAQAAQVDGSGGVVGAIVGSGLLLARAAVMAGAGVIVGAVSGTGALEAQAATMAGSGQFVIQGSGALVAQAATVTGTDSDQFISGSGDLVAQPAKLGAILRSQLAIQVHPLQITKKDNFEIIRDQIARILSAETAFQMQTAQDSGIDSAYFDLNIYTERSNPWEQWLNDPNPTNSLADTAPIVNVWWDNSSYDKSASDVVERQKATTTYNIDIYGRGVATDNQAGGHNPGDSAAAFNMQRGVRLVRNILMASHNTYLQMQGTIWGARWPSSISSYQPQIDDNSAIQVVAARISFEVEHNEFSPQWPAMPLEFVNVDVNRDPNGQWVVAQYDYTNP